MNKEAELTKNLYSVYAKYEWKRLIQDPYHRLEIDTSMIFLKKYLPKHGLILDAGGGPGRYTVELAQMGYEVILFDLVKENLDVAKRQIKKAKVQKQVKDIVEGSITDLSIYKDNSFDAVICLGGPLSHINPESERQKAISELIRVAKPNAPIFVSTMSKYGVMLSTTGGWPEEVVHKKHYNDLAFKGEDYMFRGKFYCHYFTSEELKQTFTNQNVEFLEMVGLEGLNSDEATTNKFAKKHPEAWKNWLEIHHKICTDPFVVDASGHMMIIVRKNKD